MVNKFLISQNICEPLDLQIKQKIINYLYEKLELYKYSYNILDNLYKIKYLEHNEHYVTPNFKGINYLLLALKINNQNYCVLIDKKTLSYNKILVDIKLINMYKFNINIPEIMYEGTIIDGKLINNKIFLIQESYLLIGNNKINTDLKNKFIELNSLIDNHLKDSSTIVVFKLNKLYTYLELKELIKNLSNLSYPTNGLIFFPKLSGKTYVFLENKNEKVNILSKPIIQSSLISNKKNEDITTEVGIQYNPYIYNLDYLKTRKYSFEEYTNYEILSLEKTEIMDVYNIYDDKIEKIGIAGIPTLKISQMCDDIIKDSFVKFKCGYCKQFNKWIPIEKYNN